MKVSILARKDKRDSSGTVPLYLRIADGGVTRHVSLDLRVKARDWNTKAKQIRKSHPDSAKLNRYLMRVLGEAQSIVADLLSSGGDVSPKEVKLRLKIALDGEASSDADFLTFCDTVVEDYRRRGQASTWKAYRTQVQKLRDHTYRRYRRRDLPFELIDVAFLRGFHTYLVEELGNGKNTVHKALSTVRTLLNAAIKEGLFPFEKDPFRHFTFRRERARKDKLTLDEIQALESVELEPGSLMAGVRDWFLFSFYSLGARFSDVATMKWKHLQQEDGETYLKYRMQKTRAGHSVLLPKPALEILSRYADRNTDTERFIFPILDGYDISTPEALRSAIQSRNALANKYLRSLAAQAGVERHVSFHLARHSIADHMRKSGMGLHDIKSVLGHTALATTELYLRGFDRDDLNPQIRRLF